MFGVLVSASRYGSTGSNGSGDGHLAGHIGGVLYRS